MKFPLRSTRPNPQPENGHLSRGRGDPCPFPAPPPVGVALAATRDRRLTSAPLLPILLALATALFATGCSDTSAATSSPTTDHAETACTYKAGHGVQLTPAAREFAGLTTAEVAPRGDAWTAIPRAAVLATAHGPAVYVANGEWFLRTPVELGAPLADDHVEVTGGLYEGDQVAVGGLRVLALAEIQAVNGGVGCADGH